MKSKITTLNNDILIANTDKDEISILNSNRKYDLHIPESESLKCLDWTFESHQHILALGYGSGKTLIGYIKDEKLQECGELFPRHSRACVDVSFCPSDSKFLALGLEKVRNDYGLLIWELSTDINASSKPWIQYGPSEGISSVSWFSSLQNRLVAGMSQKWIRVFDLRLDSRSSIAPIVIPTKAVYGIVTDPFHEHRFASFGEDSIIKLFDTRKSTEAVLSFASEFRHGIQHMSWSPLRSGLLATSGKDSNLIKVWDIFDLTVSSASLLPPVQNIMELTSLTMSTSNIEEPVLANVYKIKSTEPIDSFCWSRSYQNPQDLYQRIFIPKSTPPFYDTLLLSVTHPMSWSPQNGSLSFAASQNVVDLDQSDTQTLIQTDIVYIMKQRALKSYALDVVKNKEIVKDTNEELKECWDGIYNLKTQSCLNYTWESDGKNYHWTGLYTYLVDTLSSCETSVSYRLSWPCYLNEIRKKALVMMGWDFYKQDSHLFTTIVFS